MKEIFYKFKNYFLECASKFFVKYKYYLLVFFVLFLISFVTGIMTASAYIADITCDNLINGYLLNFLKKESGYFSFFLVCSVYFLIFSLIFILFTRNSFFVIINSIFLSFGAYIFGFDLCIVIISLGLAGVILGVLVLGVLGCMVFGLYISILSMAVHRYREYKKSCLSVEVRSLKNMFCCFIIAGIIILFVLSLLFSIIHIFVIVD